MSGEQRRPTVIRSKITVPALPDRLVARPRVARLIADLVARHRLVWVTATAGAGKTIAVIQAGELLRRPVAWVTLDVTDAAPGRLLVYLEAAVASAVPDAEGVVAGALGARIPHVEAAGLLAEAVGDAPLLLVLDGIEQLAGDDGDDARAVLGALIRYASPATRIVLLSREDVPVEAGGGPPVDSVAAVGETDLAFTPAEAAEALAAAGNTGIDAGRAVEVTGGWVTGVLFEAWRSREHVAGSGGEADPLHGYLSSQILSRLPPEDREFLVSTSVLDEVTPARAAALGHPGAGEQLLRLRAHHLPVVWSRGSESMRCHPRFREYLLLRLGRHDAEHVRELRRRHAEQLVTEAQFEEAVWEFLAAGYPELALAPAEAAIGPVIERLDFDVADKWLRSLEKVRADGVDRLAEAEMMLAIARENYRRGGLLADRLARAGERDRLARSSARAAAMLVWCYWHVGRVDDARAVLAIAPDGHEVEAVRYLMTLVESQPGARVPALTGNPMDALVTRVHYAHGRLRELSSPPVSPWAAAVSAPWRVGTLRATGRLAEALELYRAADAGDWAPAWMHGMVGAELMIDLEDQAAARAVLARGRDLIRASGSVVFEWLNRLIEVRLELRLARDPVAATAILDEVEAAGGRRYDFIAEALDTWRGLALLLAGGPAEAAATVLDRAVASMLSAGRDLDLPIAAVYLAEARWRAGDPEGADAAADVALAAADRQGSNHQVLVALADFPAVVSRRLDAEPGVDSPWHDLGRALRRRGVAVDSDARTVVDLTEFGHVAMTVDGQPARPRIAKSLMLLAYLAAAPGQRADREELLDALFEGRNDDSARAYLRQAAHRLRETLPEGVGPVFTGNQLGFAAPVLIRSESALIDSLLTEAAHQRDRARLDVLLRALAVLDRGPYLPGVEASWVTSRREELHARATEARMAAAQLAFGEGRYAETEALVERVLADDPYRESAWRLAMQVVSALGDEDRLITLFRRCRAALRELDIQPSDATLQLMDRLRR